MGRQLAGRTAPGTGRRRDAGAGTTAAGCPPGPDPGQVTSRAAQAGGGER